MMPRDVAYNHSEPEGMLSTVIAPLMAVCLVGGALCFSDSSASPNKLALPAAPPPVELTALEYEALRDLIPQKPELATKILFKLQTKNMIADQDVEKMVGTLPMSTVSTPLSVYAARRDLMMTARSYATSSWR